MDETALIVPIPEADPLVSRFRDKYDPSAAAGVPAHVTLLYPWLAPTAVAAADFAALATLFAAAQSRSVTFARCGRFEPKTLFLVPEPDEPFRDLTARIVARWPQCPPYRGVHVDVVPHLTVCDSITGDALDRIEMALAGGLPVTARLREALLLENRTGRWEMRQRFALG
jgi:hypothetical protein